MATQLRTDYTEAENLLLWARSLEQHRLTYDAWKVKVQKKWGIGSGGRAVTTAKVSDPRKTVYNEGSQR